MTRINEAIAFFYELLSDVTSTVFGHGFTAPSCLAPTLELNFRVSYNVHIFFLSKVSTFHYPTIIPAGIEPTCYARALPTERRGSVYLHHGQSMYKDAQFQWRHGEMQWPNHGLPKQAPMNTSLHQRKVDRGSCSLRRRSFPGKHNTGQTHVQLAKVVGRNQASKLIGNSMGKRTTCLPEQPRKYINRCQKINNILVRAPRLQSCAPS